MSSEPTSKYPGDHRRALSVDSPVASGDDAPVKTGILDLVESAYDIASDGQTWLKQANERFASRFPGVVSLGSHVISKRPDGAPRFLDAYLTGVEDPMTVFGPMHGSMSAEFAEAMFPTGTHFIVLSEHWERVKENLSSAETSSPEIEGLFGYLRSLGGDDLISVISYDCTGTGVLLSAVVKRERTKVPGRTRELYQRAAVHLAAGLRLRHALARAHSNDQPEAVFEVDGRVAHAEGPAAAVEMRPRLREAVERIDRARTKAVREREMEALGLWRGLVEGRWSLIDRHDTDGRRYYVALANPPAGVGARKLSEAEAQVVAQAAAGEPNGVIAYALGVSESTVAGHLRSAMRKLGAGSRMDLVRLGRALGAAQ